MRVVGVMARLASLALVAALLVVAVSATPAHRRRHVHNPAQHLLDETLQHRVPPSPRPSPPGKLVDVSTGVIRPEPAAVLQWLQSGSSGKAQLEGMPPLDLNQPQGQLFTDLRRRFIKRAEMEARTILGGGDPDAYSHPPFESIGANDYPYWSFIPLFLGATTPTSSFEWSGSATSCFQTNSAQLTQIAGTDRYNLTLTASGPRTPGCSDFYLFGTVDGLALQTVSSAGSTTIGWTLPAGFSPSHQWDLDTKGVRIFRFLGDALSMLGAVIDTALLFEGELTPGISPAAAARNIDFLNKYAGVSMKPRAITEVVVDESQIHSGDFFGIMRLDGMDPMLAWAMGSTTGHVTVALWIGGQLYVCESTTKAAHWPVNGVQKTPYRTWLAQVKAAGQNAVHAPLTPEARKNFNETAAMEWFNTVEGLSQKHAKIHTDYGYQTLLWGWLDTLTDNYPCLPPDYSVCLGWPSVEVLFGWMDQFVPSVGELLFHGALNHRLGTNGLRAPELFREAAAQGLAPGALPVIVEQDEWRYNTTRYDQPALGQSLVCCVFVCNMWKHAGVFANITDEVQCGELTNWDDYALNILDAPARPAECVAADPENPLCQIEGEYTLVLNDFATKAPYANMAQKCPSKPPKYDKPSDC